MDDQNIKPAPQAECYVAFQKRRLLWCSEPGWEQKKLTDAFADSLYLLKIDDGVYALELKCGGRGVTFRINNLEHYLL